MGKEIKKIQITKIMIFGTFDGLHKGHMHFFKQAKILSQNPFIIVSIARDKNVFKIKGQHPTLNENKRKKLLKNLIKNKILDKVVLSGIKNHLPHIIKEHPDIIALGYDQKVYTKNLKNELKSKGVIVKIVRLKPYKENIYKNSLLRK